LPFVLIVLVAVWVASTIGSTGDWKSDAGPAVESLAAGHVDTYFSTPTMMGPLATLVQAPFVALSGSSGLGAYQWAVIPSLLAAGLLGLYLASIARRRGASRFAQLLLAALCVVNPLTFVALEAGHPEEILTAVLVVAAIAAASEGRSVWTAVVLGGAVASKQWAVIAILPALFALPSQRLRTAIGAGAVALALILPGLIAAPDSFLGVQNQAASTGRVVTPWSVWYPTATEQVEVYHMGGERLVAHREEPPPLVGSLSHPLIVAMVLLVPILVILRHRWKLPLIAADAMALLAFLALLRSILDPVDNFYYHEPLFLALLGWDAVSSRDLPVRGLLGLGAALIFWQQGEAISDPTSFNLAYLTVVGLAGVILASSLFKLVPWTGVPRIGFFAGLSPNSGD